MRILFLCKHRISYGGNSVGLFNSANFVVNFLKSRGIEADIQFATDANDIDRLVTNYNPDVVVIEAIWVTALKMKEILTIPRHARRKWVVRIHSKLGFAQMESNFFETLREYRDLKLPNLVIAPNVFELTDDLSDFGLRTEYLPNIYYAPVYSGITNKPYDYWTIDVGCFGAMRPLKNMLTQAVAAVRFANDVGKKLYFHINGERLEQNGANTLKNIRSFFSGQSRHELVEHEWMSHEDFCRLVAKMDIGLQTSFTETFNIVTADMVTMGVPVVVSDQITWMPRETWAEPNSTYNIADRLRYIFFRKNEVLRRSKFNLQINSLLAEEAWLRFLRK